MDWILSRFRLKAKKKKETTEHLFGFCVRACFVQQTHFNTSRSLIDATVEMRLGSQGIGNGNASAVHKFNHNSHCPMAIPTNKCTQTY